MLSGFNTQPSSGGHQHAVEISWNLLVVSWWSSKEASTKVGAWSASVLELCLCSKTRCSFRLKETSSYFRLGFCASSQIYSMSIPCHFFNKAMCESPQIILEFTSFWQGAMLIMACQVRWIQYFSAKPNNFPSSQLTWYLDTAVWTCDGSL